MQDFHSIKSPITLALGQENLQQKVLVISFSLTLCHLKSVFLISSTLL